MLMIDRQEQCVFMYPYSCLISGKLEIWSFLLTYEMVLKHMSFDYVKLWVVCVAIDTCLFFGSSIILAIDLRSESVK